MVVRRPGWLPEEGGEPGGEDLPAEGGEQNGLDADAGVSVDAEQKTYEKQKRSRKEKMMDFMRSGWKEDYPAWGTMLTAWTKPAVRVFKHFGQRRGFLHYGHFDRTLQAFLETPITASDKRVAHKVMQPPWFRQSAETGEEFPVENECLPGQEMKDTWGNFIKGSSRRDEGSRREKRILTQHLVRGVHTATVIR